MEVIDIVEKVNDYRGFFGTFESSDFSIGRRFKRKLKKNGISVEIFDSRTLFPAIVFYSKDIFLTNFRNYMKKEFQIAVNRYLMRAPKNMIEIGWFNKFMHGFFLSNNDSLTEAHKIKILQIIQDILISESELNVVYERKIPKYFTISTEDIFPQTIDAIVLNYIKKSMLDPRYSHLEKEKHFEFAIRSLKNLLKIKISEEECNQIYEYAIFHQLL